MSDDPSPQMQSASYRLAALDQDFLLGESMRGVRFLLEFAKADEALRAACGRLTLVVFGSARVREDGPPREANWYAQARQFGRIASQRGGALSAHGGIRDNVIATGGGPGIMEAANKGASEAGGVSVGLGIELPMESGLNDYVNVGVEFRYFFVRKTVFIKYSQAFVVLPGGYGTLDELFEALTLVATGKITKFPIVLVGSAYWSGLLDWIKGTLLAEGKIHAEELDLIHVADTADEVVRIIKKAHANLDFG